MKHLTTLKKSVAALLAAAMALTGCSTEQMQKMKEEQNQRLLRTYPNFNSCFRQEKIAAIATLALVGGVAGKAIGGKDKGDKYAVVGAVLGGILGNSIAWGACSDAFSPKPTTVVINDRSATLTQTGQPAIKSLTIQSVNVGPLVFGRDLEVTVNYTYISSDPAARDIKARVFRNMVFTSPDDSRQEVPSKTDDTIQQGQSKSTFSIPTPSLEEAQELLQTKDWGFKFVVEVDGMRQEKLVPVTIMTAAAADALARQAAANAAAQAAPKAIAAEAPAAKEESINLKAGTALVQAPNSSTVVVRLAKATPAAVLQRTTEGNFKWVQVRLPDGKTGWFKGGPK